MLPPEVLSAIKNYVTGDFPVRLDAPSKISLFAYDNGTFIVESFLDREASVTVSTSGGSGKLKDLVTGEVISGEPVRSAANQQPSPYKTAYHIKLKPHSYLAFSEQP